MSLFEILNQFKQGKGTARSHIKNLIEMAMVDGEFLEVENELLKSIAKRNGISEKQIAEIQRNKESIKLEIPSGAKEKFHQFYDLVNMMRIDELIHTEEMKLCNFFAIKFGYHRDNIEQLIDSMISCIQNNLKADETMARVIRLI